MIVVLPWMVALGVAVLMEAVDRRRSSDVLTIEGCVTKCTSTWLVQDGVVRVFAERFDAVQYRIIIECDQPPEDVPSQVSGYPVRIRVGSFDAPPGASESAARDLVRSFPELVVPVVYPNGRIDSIDMIDGVAAVILTARPDEVLHRASQLGASSGTTLSSVEEDGVYRVEFR